MAEVAEKLWTLAEFLAFDDGTDRRHQLLDGALVAMAPALRAHGTLVMRLGRTLGNALQPPCEVIGEAGIVPPERAHSWYEADLLVTCTPGSPTDQFITEPVVIIEVLSPSTATTDLERKLPDYRTIPPVRDILIVSSTEPRIEHWRRDQDSWSVDDHRTTDSLRLTAFPITIDLRELYAGVLPRTAT